MPNDTAECHFSNFSTISVAEIVATAAATGTLENNEFILEKAVHQLRICVCCVGIILNLIVICLMVLKRKYLNLKHYPLLLSMTAMDLISCIVLVLSSAALFFIQYNTGESVFRFRNVTQLPTLSQSELEEYFIDTYYYPDYSDSIDEDYETLGNVSDKGGVINISLAQNETGHETVSHENVRDTFVYDVVSSVIYTFSYVPVGPALSYITLCILQWLAVKHPVYYSVSVTRRKCIHVTIMIWVISLVLWVMIGILFFKSRPPVVVNEEDSEEIDRRVILLLRLMYGVTVSFLTCFLVPIVWVYIHVTVLVIKSRRRLNSSFRLLRLQVIVYCGSISVIIMGTLWQAYVSTVSISDSVYETCEETWINLSGAVVQLVNSKALLAVTKLVWACRLIIEPSLLLVGNDVLKTGALEGLRTSLRLFGNLNLKIFRQPAEAKESTTTTTTETGV